MKCNFLFRTSTSLAHREENGLYICSTTFWNPLCSFEFCPECKWMQNLALILQICSHPRGLSSLCHAVQKAALQEHYTASPKRIPRVVQYLHRDRWIGCCLWCQTSVSNNFWFIIASTPQMKGTSSYLKASSPLRLFCIIPVRLRDFCLYTWFQTNICFFLWDLPEMFLVL